MQEEQQELLQHPNVRRRLKLWLFSTNYSHKFLRGIAMSIIFAAYSVILAAVMMVRESIQRGELPWYTVDAIIIGVCFLETALAPAIAWAGWWRRRTAMILWLIPTAIGVFAFFALPSVTVSNATEFCTQASVLPTSGGALAFVRLFLLLGMCLVVSLTLTAILCHSIGYMAEHSLEGLMTHFGILVIARVVGFLMFSRVMAGGLHTAVLVILVFVTMVVHVLQLLKVPETAPPAEGTVAPHKEGRGLLSSIGRVMSNKLAMSAMFAMAFNTAALWGFTYYERDFIKVKYLQTYSQGTIETQSDILRYHVIILVVLVVASKYGPHVMPAFSRRSVLKMSAILAILAVPVYVGLVLLHCTQGSVAGLDYGRYTQPNCSKQCTCDSTKNTFAPLCVVEQMTTYLSPCHAGCSESTNANGLKYLSGCVCTSGSGRALPGACSLAGCRDIFEFHKLLLLLLITFTVVILQLLGVAAVRSVDSRDRSVVIGVMIMVTSSIIFVAGHGVFLSISATTCIWFDAGACQLHSPLFSYLLGGTAAGFALIAATISVLVCFFFSDKAQPKEQALDLAL